MTQSTDFLEQLTALAEKATPGPWEACDRGDYTDFGGNSRVILGDDRRIGVIQTLGEEATEANADLLMLLRNNLPAILALGRERDALREANGILEDALQEAGDDYPGSSMQEWCQQQVKAARQALEDLILAGKADHHAEPFAIHHELGRKQEREVIVAWLRGPMVPDHSDEGGCPFDKAARMIAAGAHRD